MGHQQDMPKMQTCVLKVNIHCQGCKRKIKKLLSQVEGVYSTEVDAEQGRVTVSGEADPAMLIDKLAKARKYAEVLEPAKGQQKTVSPSNNDYQKNARIVKSKIIQPGVDNKNVPKGMKVVKEVKIMADKDETNIDDEGASNAGRPGKGMRTMMFGTGNKARTAKGKRSEEAAGRSGKIDGLNDVKNKFTDSKTNSSIGGGIGGVSHAQGIEGTNLARMGQMAQMPPVQIPTNNGGFYQANLPFDHHQQDYMTAGMMNQPQRPPLYSRADIGGRPPLPPPPAADPIAHIFSDENANGCSIM